MDRTQRATQMVAEAGAVQEAVAEHLEAWDQADLGTIERQLQGDAPGIRRCWGRWAAGGWRRRRASGPRVGSVGAGCGWWSAHVAASCRGCWAMCNCVGRIITVRPAAGVCPTGRGVGTGQRGPESGVDAGGLP